MAQTDGATDGARSAVKLLLEHDVSEDLAYLLPIELTQRHPHHGLIVIIKRKNAQPSWRHSFACLTAQEKGCKEMSTSPEDRPHLRQCQEEEFTDDAYQTPARLCDSATSARSSVSDVLH